MNAAQKMRKSFMKGRKLANPHLSISMQGVKNVAYATKAAPCGTFNIELTEEEREIGLAVVLSAGGVIIVACLVCIVARIVNKRNAKEADVPIEPALPSQEGAKMS